MDRIPISTKVLWQALSAAALVILLAVGDDVSWLPDWAEGTAVVVLPLTIAWLKGESNPAKSAGTALVAKGWSPPRA